MRTGTKFWLAVGTIASMVILCFVYMLKVDKVEAGVLGVFVGVITLICGGYFTANATITKSAIAQGNPTSTTVNIPTVWTTPVPPPIPTVTTTTSPVETNTINANSGKGP